MSVDVADVLARASAADTQFNPPLGSRPSITPPPYTPACSFNPFSRRSPPTAIPVSPTLQCLASYDPLPVSLSLFRASHSCKTANSRGPSCLPWSPTCEGCDPQRCAPRCVGGCVKPSQVPILPATGSVCVGEGWARVECGTLPDVGGELTVGLFCFPTEVIQVRCTIYRSLFSMY